MMRVGVFFGIIFLFYVACCAHALGQDPALSLSIDPAAGSTEDTFIFTVSIDGAHSALRPYLIGGDDFRLTLLGPSSEVSIVNGAVSTRVSYRYRLFPKRTGSLTTPGAEVEIEGKKYSAQPLTVVITQGQPHTDKQHGDVFLRQSLSSSRLFVGEQAVNALELYSAVRLISPQIMDLSYDDFAHHEMEDEQVRRFMDGKNFNITRVRRAIFPLKTGTLTIPERKVQTRLPSHRSRRLPSFGGLDPFDDDLFGGFLGTTTFEDKVLTSNSLEVEVVPLPAAPHQFPTWGLTSVLVGDTSISLRSDPSPVKVGESKDVIVRIESLGNISPIQHVALDLGAAARVYEESPSLTYKQKGDKLLLTKEFKLSIVPLSPGTLSIPALELGYFDTNDRTFRRASTQAVTFTVLPNPLMPTQPASALGNTSTVAAAPTPMQPTPAQPTPEQGAKAELGQLRYSEPTLVERLGDILSSKALLLITTVLAALTVSFFVLRGAITTRKHSQEIRRQVQHAESVHALRSVLAQFRAASPLQSSNQEVGTPAGHKSKTSNPDLQFEITSLIDDLDRYSYGGAPCSPEDLEQLKQRVLELYRRL